MIIQYTRGTRRDDMEIFLRAFHVPQSISSFSLFQNDLLCNS